MIDDPIETAALIAKIKKALPLPALVTGQLAKLYQKEVPGITKVERIQIEDIH